MINSKDQIEIGKYLSGNLNADERKVFENKLSTNDDFKTLFTEYHEIWLLTNQLNYPTSSTEQAWDSFQQKVKAPKKKLGFDWLKVAASITLLAAFTFVIWFVFSDKAVTYSEANVEFFLNDNSGITLDKNSQLKVGTEFGEELREVSLDGQAFFDIEKSNKPFVVTTNNGTVTVLGTEFSIHTSANGFDLVELYEGSVRYESAGETYVLKPGQQLTLTNSKLDVSSISNKSFTWQGSQEIKCKNSPLAYILSQIELNYGVQYNVRSRFLEDRYTVNLPKDNLETCLKVLSQISDKKFILKNNVIVLK